MTPPVTLDLTSDFAGSAPHSGRGQVDHQQAEPDPDAAYGALAQRVV